MFNRAVVDATRRNDRAVMLALWDDDDGVISLGPGRPPIVGKGAISRFIVDVVEHGAHTPDFEMTCEGVEVHGDFATEHCEVEGNRGRILFVLHRGGDRAWRMRREMWQPGERCGCL